jgi:hypothetical protein
MKTEQFFITKILAFFVGVIMMVAAFFALGITHGLVALGYGALLLAGRELMVWGNDQ